MNVKILKRAEREKITGQIPAAADQTKNGDSQTMMMATVKSWIVEMRKKHENERLAVKVLFSKEADYCS